MPATADFFAYADEAGVRGPVRDLTAARDHETSLICTLPVPAEYDDYLREHCRPLFERFTAAAPPGAALHITDAFSPGNEAWGAVAELVRYELFSMIARQPRCRGLRCSPSRLGARDARGWRNHARGR